MNNKSSAGFLTFLPIILKTLWLYLPGVLIVLVAKILLWDFTQGQDIIVIALENDWRATSIALFGIFFLAFIIWYSGRLVAYSHDELYAIPLGKLLLFHAPRYIAFMLFFVLIVAFLNIWHGEKFHWLILIILWIAETGLYVIVSYTLSKWVEKTCKENRLSRVRMIRKIVHGILLTIIAIALMFHSNAFVIAIALLAMQVCLLYMVIVRRQLAEEVVEKLKAAQDVMHNRNLLSRYLNWILEKQMQNPSFEKIKNSELFTFVVFHFVVIVSIILFLVCTFSLYVSRAIGPLGILFLCLGVLLMLGNYVSLLSAKLRTNVFVLLVLAVFLVGLFSEPHKLRMMDNPKPQQRQSFRAYVADWVANSERSSEIDAMQDSSVKYPVFMVMSDGGASRSGYWAAEVLGKLTDATKDAKYPFGKHLFCLSGASGGSVGNGTYAAALINENIYFSRPNGFQKSTTSFLKNDFLSFLLVRMLGSDLFAPVSNAIGMGDRAFALETSLEKADSTDATLLNMINGPFDNFYTGPGKNPHLPIIAFNVTRMQDGQPGVFCNIDLDTLAFGSRVDLVEKLDTMRKKVRYSTAMITSARFPYVSPAGVLNEGNYFVDGGYFDNSGAGLVHEMLLELQNMQKDNSLDKTLRSRLAKLNFYVIHIVNNPYSQPTEKKVHPFVNDLAAPLMTIVGSYQSQTSVNNLRLQKHLEMFQAGKSYIEMNLYTHPDSLNKQSNHGKPKMESYPMNWVISKKSIDGMSKKVEKYADLDSIIARLNRGASDIFRRIETQSSAPQMIPVDEDAVKN